MSILSTWELLIISVYMKHHNLKIRTAPTGWYFTTARSSIKAGNEKRYSFFFNLKKYAFYSTVKSQQYLLKKIVKAKNYFEKRFCFLKPPVWRSWSNVLHFAEHHIYTLCFHRIMLSQYTVNAKHVNWFFSYILEYCFKENLSENSF